MKKYNRRKFIQLAGIIPAGIALPASLKPENKSETNSIHSSYDPYLEINLKNIEWNINQIKKRVKNRPVMAVIKCNAYGHGLVETGRYLEKINIKNLAVGKLQEAIELRNAGIKTDVLNFGPFSNSDAEAIVGKDVSQSVYLDNVRDLNRAAGRFNKQVKVHILIDTGLGRVGIPYESADAFVENVSKLENVKIEGIFTTFTEDKEFDKVQLRRLLEICENASRKGISTGLKHAASSAGVCSFLESALDMVRPGICIYGHYPSDAEYERRIIDLRPAMSLKTKVSYVKTLKPGDSISYHRKYKPDKPETIATISLGYSDGLPLNVPGNAAALVHGKKFPVEVDVTSNHSYVRVTGETGVKPGDEVALYGSQNGNSLDAQELAKAAGTSVYKILIHMNPLMKRSYRS